MVEQIIIVAALLFSVFTGFAAMRRSQRWEHWGQWSAAASVLMLGIIASHNVYDKEPSIVMPQKPTVTPAQVEILAWVKDRADKLLKERRDEFATTSRRPD